MVIYYVEQYLEHGDRHLWQLAAREGFIVIAILRKSNFLTLYACIG